MTEKQTTKELIELANKHKVVEGGYYSKIAKSLLKHLWSLTGGFRTSRGRYFI